MRNSRQPTPVSVRGTHHRQLRSCLFEELGSWESRQIDTGEATSQNGSSEESDNATRKAAITRPTAQRRSGGETVFGQTANRQVLVVGDSVVGQVLTALLQRAGFDPVLTAASRSTSEPTVTYLNGTATDVLETLGVGDCALGACVPIDQITVRSVRADGTLPASPSPGGAEHTETPVVIPTQALHRGLAETRWTTRARKSVETLSRRDSGVVVEFENGVREWFDIVVDATVTGPSLPDFRGEPSSAALTEWNLALDTPVDNSMTDVWQPTTAVQHFPDPGGDGSHLRVTAVDSETAITDAVHETIGDAVVIDQASGARPTARTVRLPDKGVSRSWWGSGRVCLVARPAGLSTPASGSPVALGIENAVVLVSELARDGRAVTDVVEAYASDRARRLRESPTTIAEPSSADADFLAAIPSQLQNLMRLRTAALRIPVDLQLPPRRDDRLR